VSIESGQDHFLPVALPLRTLQRELNKLKEMDFILQTGKTNNLVWHLK